MTKYVVSTYIPGYLPESEPYSTNDIDDAINVLISEIRNTIDAIADDGEFLAADTALHTAGIDAKARDALKLTGVYFYDTAGYRHAIEAY